MDPQIVPLFLHWPVPKVIDPQSELCTRFQLSKLAKKQNPSELCRTNSLPLWANAGVHNGVQQIVHVPSRVCIFHGHHKVKCCPENGLVLQFGDPQQTKQSKPCFGKEEVGRHMVRCWKARQSSRFHAGKLTIYSPTCN